ncbi:hypothetical protein [Aeromicrobium sp. 9AM]|uniref:hypothetical protein n=1 Tax=Aeromicrobium sp. 9AM TaxID=2653126 RepID=UPI0012EFE8B3|nr:hypothetical protein [Aeromicrobium sp. 9AM]VXB04450.1 hypothetical protein AERO9AM_10272 [Aeromicrobium sp. 9AM]
MSSRTPFRCPFCGEAGVKTREHVWAQWMRKSVGAQQLLKGATGRRVPVAVGDLQIDERGKYQLVERDIVRVAELLPHVTIDVCLGCNGGWMKRLEDDAKTLMGPWSAAGWPIQLDQDAQTALAVWATKSWMAYALIHQRDEGPFTSDERRAMVSEPGPLARTRIWVVHSDAPTAWVGMGLHPTLMKPSDEVPDVTTEMDNAGFGFLAYNELAFFMAIAPEPKSPLLDFVEEDMDSNGFAKRIWPASAPTSFPQHCAPAPVMSDLLAIPGNFHRATGLPVVGLGKTELEDVRRAYEAGADAFQIRAVWQPESLARLERKRISDDPDGYAKTWRPYKVLGGIEWHGGRFEAAVEHYRTAQRFGATVQDIGSQLCDALMFAGEFAKAQRVCDEVMSEGRNEWRDVFRDAILYEVVEELGLKRQKRRRRREDVTMTVSDEAIRVAKRYLRRSDALDVVSWSVLAHDVRPDTRLSTVMASAYLGDSVMPWFGLSCEVVPLSPGEPLRDAVSEGLADSATVVAELLRLFDESADDDLLEVRQFVEESSHRTADS